MNKFNNLEVAYLRVDEKTYAIKTFCNELTDFLKKLEEKFSVRLINIPWTELNSTVLKKFERIELFWELYSQHHSCTNYLS